MKANSIIFRFRNDLRLRDNPALNAAAKAGAIIPLYIHDPSAAPGGAAGWWLHHSLESLSKELRRRGCPLCIRSGVPEEILSALIKETGASAVYCSRTREPAEAERDRRFAAQLEKSGIGFRQFESTLLYSPETVLTKQGKPYQVFTPFWKACCVNEPQLVSGAVPKLNPPEKLPDSGSLESLNLLPEPDWAGGFRENWKPGEKGAWRQLEHFLDEAIAGYDAQRDFPARRGTSRLSPHLHFGEISPRAVRNAVQETMHLQNVPGLIKGAEAFLRQLGWREFAYHLLHHFPHTVEQPLREKFAVFQWEENEDGLRAWQQGRTGYPIVDAGMRELWHTGWMHNRVRMIVASFLVKDLLIHWQHGAEWFMDTLVDADLANNTLGWQWVAGCGADAAPYFRIFNPVRQGEKFDPKGAYVRRWIPELAKLPDRWIHAPWEASASVLEEAGVELEKTYPKPLVDHSAARLRALEAYDAIRE